MPWIELRTASKHGGIKVLVNTNNVFTCYKDKNGKTIIEGMATDSYWEIDHTFEEVKSMIMKSQEEECQAK